MARQLTFPKPMNCTLVHPDGREDGRREGDLRRTVHVDRDQGIRRRQGPDRTSDFLKGIMAFDILHLVYDSGTWGWKDLYISPSDIVAVGDVDPSESKSIVYMSNGSEFFVMGNAASIIDAWKKSKSSSLA